MLRGIPPPNGVVSHSLPATQLHMTICVGSLFQKTQLPLLKHVGATSKRLQKTHQSDPSFHAHAAKLVGKLLGDMWQTGHPSEGFS